LIAPHQEAECLLITVEGKLDEPFVGQRRGLFGHGG
jgi:hypothetical protein